MHTPLSCEVAPLWICSHCILRWGLMGQWKWPSSRRNYVSIELRWEVVRGHGKSSRLLLHHSPIPCPYSATFSSQSEITLLSVLYFYWLSPLVEYKCLIKYELTLTWLLTSATILFSNKVTFTQIPKQRVRTSACLRREHNETHNTHLLFQARNRGSILEVPPLPSVVQSLKFWFLWETAHMQPSLSVFLLTPRPQPPLLPGCPAVPKVWWPHCLEDNVQMLFWHKALDSASSPASFLPLLSLAPRSWPHRISTRSSNVL